MNNQPEPIRIDVRARFRASLRQPTDFSAIVSQQLVQDACRDVIAHMAMIGHTRESLNGAIEFVELFLNFSDPNPAVKIFPIRKLHIQTPTPYA